MRPSNGKSDRDRTGCGHGVAWPAALLLLAALAVVPGAARAQESPWIPIGPAPIPNGLTLGVPAPTSSRVTAIAIHPTNANLVYVGTTNGGVYRTTDGGASWTHLMDGAQSLAIGSVTIAPSSPETVYVGTGDPQLSIDSFFGVGLYRIDNASSATPTVVGPLNLTALGANVFSGRAIAEVQVHPTDPATIFVATTSGVGGIGSAQIPLPPSRGVYRSTNATSPSPIFTKLDGLAGGIDVNVRDILLDPGNPNRLIANVVGDITNSGIHLSTDALAPNPSFVRSAAFGGSSNDAVAEFAIHRDGVSANPTLYAATGASSGTVLRSVDGGVTWQVRVDNNFCSPQCFYDIAIDVDPSNPDRVYLGGSDTLPFGISTNGGTSFTASSTGIHPWTHVVAVAPSNPAIVYLGSEGGIFRSSDSAASWQSLNNTTFDAVQIASLDVHPTDPELTLAAGLYNGTLLRRADTSWLRVDAGRSGRVLIDQSATDTTTTNLYHTYQSTSVGPQGYAFLSNPALAADGAWRFRGCLSGAGNGISCNGGVLFFAPIARGPGTPNSTYYGSDRLYRSGDTGVTHTVVSQNPIVAGVPISAIGISPLNDAVRVVGLRSGGLYGTHAGSTSLANLDPTNAVPDHYVANVVGDPGDLDTVYVTLSAFGQFGVWRTANLSDGPGASWEPVATGLPLVPVNALEIDPVNPNVLYVGTDAGVFASANAGATWVPFGTGLPRVPVFDLALTVGGKLRIATLGRGMWEAEAGFADGDDDGIADLVDNCPFAPNASQLDSGGVRAGTPPDGIGNACQCGDVANDDGIVSAGDIATFRSALASPSGAGLSPAAVTRCNVIGSVGACTIRDLAVIARAVRTPPLAPGISQVCDAATAP